MCLAELNRSTTPCAHTYFRLSRPCSTSANLSNCSKLSLSGWENRTEACAFCTSSASLDPANYRLLGYYDDAGIGRGNLSRTNSLSTMTTSSQASARRDSRRGSLARSHSSNESDSGHTNGQTTAAYAMAPLTQLASERNIHRNQRIDSYLAQLPEAVMRKSGQTFAEVEGIAGTPGRSRANSTSSGGAESSAVDVVPDLPSSGKKWSMKGRRIAKMF